MSSAVTKSERLQELQAALTLRHHEVSQLAKRKDELLRLQRNGGHEGAASDAANATVGGGQPEDEAVRLFVADHPAFSFCIGRSGANMVWDLPPEQIGNVVAQLDAGLLALRQRTGAAVREREALGAKQRQLATKQVQLEERIEMFAELTGLPPNQTRSGTARLNSAPVGAYAKGSPKDLPALKKLVVKVTKELRLAEVIRQKNLKLMQELMNTVSKQTPIKESTNEARNKIRCLEKDVSEKKATLKELLMEHEVLDKQLAVAMRPTASNTTRYILDRDVSELKRKVEDCVEGERRVQDRVIKAQEYRVLQLEKRLATVKRALKNHRLEGKVEDVILKSIADGEQSSPQRATHFDPSVDGAATTNNDGETTDREALYNIDTIVPPMETVHPALYSLLASEKDALAKTVSQQETLMRDKDRSAEALAYEVASLTLALDEAQTLLEMTVSQVALTESQQQDAVVADVMLQREQYKALLHEKTQLRKGQQRAREQRSGSRSDKSSKDGSRSPSNSPQATMGACSLLAMEDVSGSAPAGGEGAQPVAGAIRSKSGSRVRFTDEDGARNDDAKEDAAGSGASSATQPAVQEF